MALLATTVEIGMRGLLSATIVYPLIAGCTPTGIAPGPGNELGTMCRPNPPARLDFVIVDKTTGEVLNNFVVGKLKWEGVRIHDTVVAPLTSSPIWLAPREVQAGSVFIPSAGEGERFLFYRGVAHLDALLQTKLSHGQLSLRAPAQFAWLDALSIEIPGVWLADVRADGNLAFREHGALSLLRDKPGAELAKIKRFGSGDYKADGAKLLRASLKRVLINQGLYADEAEAMLNTWKASYFEKPGLRVFYIVPRQWTDYFLPLELSVPARVNRVIVGRIDLPER